MLSKGGSFCAQFDKRAKRLPGDAKASPHFVVVRSENAGLFSKVSPIWRYGSLFSDGNAESGCGCSAMRRARAGVGLCLCGVRKFRAGGGRLWGRETKNPPNGDGLFGG